MPNVPKCTAAFLKQNLVGLIFIVFYYTLKIELLLAYVRNEGRKECYMNSPIPVLYPISPNDLQSKSFILLPASACVIATDCNMLKLNCTQ